MNVSKVHLCALNIPNVSINLDHMVVNVLMGTTVMVTVVLILMIVLTVIMIATIMPFAPTLKELLDLRVLYANVTLVISVMEWHVTMLMNVPKSIGRGHFLFFRPKNRTEFFFQNREPIPRLHFHAYADIYRLKNVT